MGIEKWAKSWQGKPKKETIGDKIKGFIAPPPPARQMVIHAIYKLNTQIHRLDYSLAKLQSHDKQLFEKTVNALIEGDKAKASMYANEIVEIRKMAKVIMTVRHALERVKIRLETYLVIGDMQASLAPAVVALRQVTGYLKGMMPDVFAELMEIDEALQATIMQTTLEAPGLLSSEYVSEEAQKILRDASIVAEQRLKQQFPELPSLEIPTSTGTPNAASVEEGK